MGVDCVNSIYQFVARILHLSCVVLVTRVFDTVVLHDRPGKIIGPHSVVGASKTIISRAY